MALDVYARLVCVPNPDKQRMNVQGSRQDGRTLCTWMGTNLDARGRAVWGKDLPNLRQKKIIASATCPTALTVSMPSWVPPLPQQTL